MLGLDRRAAKKPLAQMGIATARLRQWLGYQINSPPLKRQRGKSTRIGPYTHQ